MSNRVMSDTQTCWDFTASTTNTRDETQEEKAQRLQDARDAAAKALFDQYEKWNDRGTFLNIDKPSRCKTHNEQDCVLCQPRLVK